jgi:ABC-type uncharacterized transport system substrate-binding protein
VAAFSNGGVAPLAHEPSSFWYEKDAQSTLQDLAEEVIRSGPDVIVVGGNSPLAQAVGRATSTIPVVVV